MEGPTYESNILEALPIEVINREYQTKATNDRTNGGNQQRVNAVSDEHLVNGGLSGLVIIGC